MEADCLNPFEFRAGLDMRAFVRRTMNVLIPLNSGLAWSENGCKFNSLLTVLIPLKFRAGLEATDGRNVPAECVSSVRLNALNSGLFGADTYLDVDDPTWS